mmetsp:Transcript_10446/g.33178  ORF Transcript_10446/g.33178 Transcript_10446/m.33178 type:complete len:222 (-) Transcript_10446:3277-3942(-)
MPARTRHLPTQRQPRRATLQLSRPRQARPCAHLQQPRFHLQRSHIATTVCRSSPTGHLVVPTPLHVAVVVAQTYRQSCPRGVSVAGHRWEASARNAQQVASTHASHSCRRRELAHFEPTHQRVLHSDRRERPWVLCRPSHVHPSPACTKHHLHAMHASLHSAQTATHVRVVPALHRALHAAHTNAAVPTLRLTKAPTPHVHLRAFHAFTRPRAPHHRCVTR